MGSASNGSPWVHIVRGTDSSSCSGCGDREKIEEDSKPLCELGSVSENGNVGGKKPVWNRVSTSEGEAVMGAASWPALSESTKPSTKSITPPFVFDPSPSPSQGTGMFSPTSHRQGIGSTANHTPNHVAPPARQRPNRRVNGGRSDNMSSNGGLGLELAPNGAGKFFHSAGEPSSKENAHQESGGQRGGSGSQSHGGGDHQQQQRNSYRRGGSGPHPRDGSQHHSHGGRRDQDRGNQDWNPHRNFGSRDAQMQPQRGSSRPFFRGPSHANMAYIPPPPIAFRPPFVTPMIYPGPDVPSPVFYPPHLDPFRALPLVAPVAPLYFPFADPHLQMKIVNQIEYYFSNANIVKDRYLRQNMDEQGWVPIKLIAGFNLVHQLTDDIQQILVALQSSTLLEVQGEKVRRRDDWSNWIIPQSAQHSGGSSPQSTPKFGNDKLAEHLQSLALNDSSIPRRSSSGELSSR